MNGRFPALSLAVTPPFAPMEAEPTGSLPSGAGWQYEPKWDGFRCLAFRDGRTVVLQSKSGEPLTRYFPELVMAVAQLSHQRFAIDGEVVVFAEGGRMSYDDLAQRIHPSARRVAQLSAKTPATLLVFDLLAEDDESLIEKPLADRRKRLEKFFKGQEIAGLHLSPATTKRPEALGWLKELAGAGLDGLIAKRKDEPYRAGERAGMVKMKLERTCECVVGGFRKKVDENGGGQPSTLLLGLYDDEGLLHYVGATEALPPETRAKVAELVGPLVEPPAAAGTPATSTAGFSGRGPGPEGRATRPRDFEAVKPALVCEVRFDRMSGDRFRTPPTLLRFRPDKKPKQCTFDQVRPPDDVGRGFELIGL